ncbi:unnamed protein product [Linum tenue]|uniref:ABC transporter domain-containing protein n=1 Tax=Linum tenue TaxID=586396 RepID=A0AAV0GR91_9ROSI|nr:unnamed protein product [Linum tenue]
MDSETDKTVEGSCLLWQDLSVTLACNNFGTHSNVVGSSPSTTKYLVNGLTGLAQSHRIMAVMGPSGSGKSTFLDALADVFLGTLTVKETLYFGARLRLPELSNAELDEVIEETMDKMGLEECGDTKVGNWHLRGISGGERRRLSIAVEILAQPEVLCLDEATTGLDSAASFFVVQALRNVARSGKIVVCSIHQPTNDVFRLFDDLLLISSGEAVYFGECKGAVKFFAESGYPCPTRRNPPDHFLRCISPEFDQVLAALKQTQRRNDADLSAADGLLNGTTADARATLVNKYKSSSFADTATKKIQELALLLITEKHDDDSQSSSQVVPVKKRKQQHQWWSQFCTLTHRSILHMCRDLGYYWLRIFFYIMVALSTGTLEFDIGTSSDAVIARGKVDGFLYGLMICLSIGGLPFFLDEIKAFRGEREGGYYGEAVYVLSNYLSSLPFTIFISISSGSILYTMVKFHPGFSHLLYFCINLFFCISVSEACVFFTASLISNPLPAMGAAIGVTVLNLMPSVVFRPIPDLPKIFWRYPLSYISYAAWGTQGNLKNDMMGLEFDSEIPGRPKITGEFILEDIYEHASFFSSILALSSAMRNPPDHFLRCIAPEFDQVLAALKQTQRLNFAEKHGDDDSKSSSEVVPVKNRKIGKQQQHQWWNQFFTLTHRSSLHMCRDLGYYWLRIFFYIMVALSTGTLEFDIGTSNAAVIARGKVDGFLYGLMICLSIGGLPFFLDEIKAFRGESQGGYYSEAAYVLSNFLSSLPFTIFISFSSGSILYSMVKFHPGFSHLLYFCINLFFSISVSEACVFVTASLVSNPLPAMGAAIGVTVLNLMPSIITRPLPDLPNIIWRYPLSYISFAAWGTQGNLKNDMMGLEFDSAIPGRPKITGESILKNSYGMNIRYSKWWDVAALFCLLLAYRLVLVFTIYNKQRIPTPFRRIYPERGLKPTKIQQA